MKRKYIDELGITYEKTPQGWNTGINDPRMDTWMKQRDTYGFDERETWGLTYAFELWLYERLLMYKEVNCIDTEFHKITYKGETITFGQALDRMIDGLRLSLQGESYDLTNEEHDKVEDVRHLFVLCYPHLWW